MIMEEFLDHLTEWSMGLLVLTISKNSRYILMKQGRVKQLKQQVALNPKEFFFTFNSK